MAGVVTIFCDHFSIDNHASLNFGASDQAANLTIIASTSVTIDNNTNMKGAVYAPGVTITQE